MPFFRRRILLLLLFPVVKVKLQLPIAVGLRFNLNRIANRKSLIFINEIVLKETIVF